MGIRLASLWSPKAGKWLDGRRNLFELLENKLPADNKPLVWMHCASLGEFEQGRPLLEKMKQTYPHIRLLLTFFSPSGYEVRKDYKGADLVAYLPMDGRRNARIFLEITQPVLAIFVKYESWFYYLKALQARAIPTLLVSAIFTKQQHYFGSLGTFLREMLNCYSHIFVQDKHSLQLASQYGIKAPCSISGDTRFDRVNEIASQSFDYPVIASFCCNQKVIIAGSTWKEDEVILAAFLHCHPEIRAVIAPHETDPASCRRLLDEFPKAILLSEVRQSINTDVQVLIINSMGMLSMLYRWATVAYIGGGFNKSGIHNLLEAAVYGKVTVFGPNHNRSAEAAALIENGAGFSYTTSEQFNEIMDLMLLDNNELQHKERIAYEYVQQNLGASAIILKHISKLGLLN